jgi:hypothetical protein
MSDPESKWSRLSSALREQGAVNPEAPSAEAPLGFATRVVAKARIEARADATGLQLWRRWSLAGACAAVLACGTLFLIQPSAPPSEQFIPVPTLDDLPSLPQS